MLVLQDQEWLQIGEKCSYAHRQVDELPRKESEKDGDQSAAAMLKKHESYDGTGKPVVSRDTNHNVWHIARHTKIRDQNPSLGNICPGEPQCSPNAPKFEERSQEETEWQEQGAREAEWKTNKATFTFGK